MSSLETINDLRQRVERLQGTVSRVPVPTIEALKGLISLSSGGTYGVDNASLVLALLAGPSQAGAWSAVVGAYDLGYEAAASFGVDLKRTVVVPDPGPHWLEVTAALIAATSVVVVRPPGHVNDGDAARLSARLRKHSSVLIAWGPWPRCEARLSLEHPVWEGIGEGHGHIRRRQVTLTVRRGSAPPRRTPLFFPDERAQIRAEALRIAERTG